MNLLLRAILVLGIAFFSYEYIKFPSRNSHSKHDAKYEIESVFLESWLDYRSHAWGSDVYGPISKNGHTMGGGKKDPLGWIVVDSLDTLMVMYNGTKDADHKAQFLEEIELAERWISDVLSYNIDYNVNIFETTIRMLGGLLSAYHCSQMYGVGNSTLYLEKAIDLGDRLALSFGQSGTGIPYSSINLLTGESTKNHVDDGASSTAEFTTLQMEFKYLSYITGNQTYWRLCEKVYEPLYKNNDLLGPRYRGLAPIYTQPDTGFFYGSNIRLGSRGDSFYEYLLKQYLMTGETLYQTLFQKSMDSVKELLVSNSKGDLGLTYIAEKEHGIYGPSSPKFDHLVCFMGGVLATSATHGMTFSEAASQHFWNSRAQEDWKLGEEITRSCYETYHQSPCGLAPEIVVFNDGWQDHTNWWVSKTKDFYVKPADAHNLQRPETVESIMFMFQLSKDEKYRNWGWQIFESFKEYTKTIGADGSIAYTSLKNILATPIVQSDNMESFWLAETLKYLYFLFEDDLDLTKITFNTEAHIFPVFDKKRMEELGLSTGWHL